MKTAIAGVLACVLCVFGSTTGANAHHPGGVVVVPIVSVFKSGGGAALTGGAVATGAFIGVVGVGVTWCAFNQPKRDRRRDTFVDGSHDIYPTQRSRPDGEGCLNKKKKRTPPPISING